MRVAVAASGRDLSANLADRFARAEYFIIYDLESGDFQVVDNSTLEAHGAGPRVVQMLASQGIDAIILPGIGRNAFEALNAVGIKAYLGKPGSVMENIEMFKNGDLEELKAPTKMG
jgi:predicted Fe-Mo cluster-binding NifX family protein